MYFDIAELYDLQPGKYKVNLCVPIYGKDMAEYFGKLKPTEITVRK